MLRTDAYKFSMAQAGFPLREETFYFSFRTGGYQFVSIDLAAGVRELIEDLVAPSDAATKFLVEHDYDMTHAMRDALVGSVRIRAVPKGTWVFEREPILTITGPSFLVSFLEPMLIWFNYPIQLATAAKKRTRDEGSKDDAIGSTDAAIYGDATCDEHRDLMVETLAKILGREPKIEVDRDGYFERVRATVEQLVDAAGGDPSRIFEVGMRSAVCMEQHRIALAACKAAGVEATSNVALAFELGMKPVGTMGHEHVQRWGDDLSAFRAMRDTRHGVPSYLLDTFDTIESGLPVALRVMRERAHPCAVRYDSGNKVTQYLIACEMFREAGFAPIHIIEDGLDLALTQKFEELRRFTNLPPDQQIYGYGGSIVAQPMQIPHIRDRVSAVYKLSETSREPRMKFGNEQGLGKTSLPGRPVIWRRLRGDGPLGIIGQEGEPVPADCICLNGREEAMDTLQLQNQQMFDDAAARSPFTPSEGTRHLMDQLANNREKPSCQ